MVNVAAFNVNVVDPTGALNTRFTWGEKCIDTAFIDSEAFIGSFLQTFAAKS